MIPNVAGFLAVSALEVGPADPKLPWLIFFVVGAVALYAVVAAELWRGRSGRKDRSLANAITGLVAVCAIALIVLLGRSDPTPACLVALVPLVAGVALMVQVCLRASRE